jgi:NADP-dependent aldehyde dehydrogenase
MSITTTDPRTGQSAETTIQATEPEEVRALAEQARGAAAELDAWGRARRADLLDAMAAAIEADRARLVETAMAETGLPEARLVGETGRSAFQLRLFADVLRDGGYLEAAIDTAAQTPLGAQPDVRRMLVPLGPVAVFGSSNFPFAFSVLGGDVASAIAAGCPVVAKAHSSHPETSRRSYDVVAGAVKKAGAPEGTIGIVYGQAAGTALVQEPSITAVGFTGSLGAAQALEGAIARRDQPIPFYGELSSINPLIVSRAAASARTSDIAEGIFTSVSGSAGQLCTKPGLAFVPDGAEGDALTAELVRLVDEAPAAVLLNSRIRDSYNEIAERLISGGAVQGGSGREEGAGFVVAPRVLLTRASEIDQKLAEECFGPLIVVVRYADMHEVTDAMRRVPRSLTLTVHVEDSDVEAGDLLGPVRDLAGRLIVNGYPTGVRVSWAQTHGGPWPATNNQHTSVGATSIRRWLRPVSWQSCPQAWLPHELQDGATVVPRRVDGRLVLPN